MKKNARTSVLNNIFTKKTHGEEEDKKNSSLTKN